MAKFSQDAAARVARATRIVERSTKNDPAGRGRWGEGDADGTTWFKLDANLAAGGTAAAYRMIWSASGASGAGAYTAEGSTKTVTDVSGQHWGLKYEWVQCRPIGSTNGLVWEVVSPGAPRHQASLTGALNYNSSASATVTVRSQSVTVTVYDRFMKSGQSLASGKVLGIAYDVPEAKWIAEQAPCP